MSSILAFPEESEISVFEDTDSEGTVSEDTDVAIIGNHALASESELQDLLPSAPNTIEPESPKGGPSIVMQALLDKVKTLGCLVESLQSRIDEMDSRMLTPLNSNSDLSIIAHLLSQVNALGSLVERLQSRIDEIDSRIVHMTASSNPQAVPEKTNFITTLTTVPALQRVIPALPTLTLMLFGKYSGFDGGLRKDVMEVAFAATY
jgi:hypothetical protein